MKSFRVYFVRHAAERVSGVLMRRRPRLFHAPLAAIGNDEASVLAQLEHLVLELQANEPKEVEPHLWDDVFEMRIVRVDVHPETGIGGQRVIGKRQVPLRLAYAWSRLPHGGYRVMLPRFEWQFVVEDLAIAPAVIREVIASSFSGEEGRWIYSYREDGPEHVQSWAPALLRDKTVASALEDDAGDFPELAEVAEEWVSKAERRQLEPCVGDDPLFRRLQPLLLQDPPPSLLLVGPSGVGKTTFVRRLAKLLLELRRGRLGDRRNVLLWSTSSDRIVSGMVYLGMWQERCLNIVEELSSEGHYLYVDRLGDFMQPQSDGASLADLFAAAVEGGEIGLIAECDDHELDRCRQLRPSLVDSMHIVRVPEMDRANLLAVMERYVARQDPHLKIRDVGYRRIVSHLAGFRPDVRFPGKAFRFLDWLCQQGPRQDAAASPPSRRAALGSNAMSRRFSDYSGVPIEVLSDELPGHYEFIASKLQQKIIGQDDACTIAARVVARLKAGLNDPQRPIGTLFFVGPTGVGKTELAKQLAAYLFGARDRLIRLDMSEYGAPGSAERMMLVGPRLRTLAQRVREQPLSVVLFDEIEKAHAEVFDLLLGILDEGRLGDSSGRLVDFRMTLILMTSNLGAERTREVGFGGKAVEDHRQAVMRYFRPEMFNRIDHVISFRRLSLQDVEQIVHLEMALVRDRAGLKRRNIQLQLTPEAQQRLAQLGYHPHMGARPLKRVIEERVVMPLAARLAADPAYRDRQIRVCVARTTADDLVV